MKSDPIRVSVGGGKGGVGKSIVSVNLACSLAALGLRTVLVDGDLGAPNLHTLLGVTNVGPTLHALLERRITRIEEALVGTEVPRLSLVAGASGVPGHANPGHQEKLKLLRQIASMDADAVVIDVGAGTSYNTLDLFTAGQVRLIVATPELTSLQNAYVFAKAVMLREIAALAKSENKLEAWSAAFDHGETSRMSRWLGRLEEREPALAQRIRGYLAAPGTALVGNRVGATAERQPLLALSRLGREFLEVDLPVVATLPSAQSVLDSVRLRTPAVVGPHADHALARAFMRLAEHVVSSERRARDPGPSDALGSEPAVDEREPLPGFASELGARQRRETRMNVSLGCIVHAPAGESPGVIVDLSPSGARISSELAVRVGERVELRVAQGGPEVVLPGVVRHAGRSAFGLAFDAGAASRVQRLAALEPQALGPS
jgi:flagellar biosynthesis protein FlhG